MSRGPAWTTAGVPKGQPPRVAGWLAWLGGGQRPILAQAPGDLVKYSAMGGVLLSTAGVAAASASFALDTAVNLSPVASILAGLIWGVVILNLDRMLIVSMTRDASFRRNLVAAIPRVLLAVVIGAVISVPLVLRIFQPEIERELVVIRQENLLAAQDQLRTRFSAIPDLEKQEAALQDVVAGRSRASVADDPEVKRLQAAYDQKTIEFNKAEADVVCENEGTCGSGQIGRGPAYAEKVAIRDRLARERADLRRQLDAATAAALERITGGSTQAAVAAQADLTRVQGELARLRADKLEAEQDFAVAGENATGLLARMEALDRLSSERRTLGLANWALFLLFLAIEVLPVLVKLLSLAGPPTLYDKLVARREKDAKNNDKQWSAQQQAITGIRLRVRTELEQDRADAQVRRGKAINAQLVREQGRIARKALDVWAAVAEARSDAELARWFRRHSATQHAGASGKVGPSPAGYGGAPGGSTAGTGAPTAGFTAPTGGAATPTYGVSGPLPGPSSRPGAGPAPGSSVPSGTGSAPGPVAPPALFPAAARGPGTAPAAPKHAASATAPFPPGAANYPTAQSGSAHGQPPTDYDAYEKTVLLASSNGPFGTAPIVPALPAPNGARARPVLPGTPGP